MLKRHKIIAIIFIFLFISIGFGFLFINSYESEVIGSETLGYVTKDTFSYYSDDPEIKIAVVSGIHPREKLSTDTLPQVAQVYALWNDVKIVNYKVTVSVDYEKFYESRNNGESLVRNYVVNDIAKSNYDLVIIGHDHEKGYGEGFYIATPSMDAKSMNLAEKVNTNLSDFNYYKRDTSKAIESNSVITVDNPIVATGTPLFVYEIPEWLGVDEAFAKSYDLLKSSVQIIKELK